MREANNNGVLNQLLTLNNGPLKPLLGITSRFNEQKNTVEYWIGVEHIGDVTGEFSSIKIPAAKWAIFEVRGPAQTAIPSTWRQIYSEWFPENEYEPASSPCIEAYTDSDPNSPASVNEIWVAVK